MVKSIGIIDSIVELWKYLRVTDEGSTDRK